MSLTLGFGVVSLGCQEKPVCKIFSRSLTLCNTSPPAQPWTHLSRKISVFWICISGLRRFWGKSFTERFICLYPACSHGPNHECCCCIPSPTVLFKAAVIHCCRAACSHPEYLGSKRVKRRGSKVTHYVIPPSKAAIYTFVTQTITVT